MPELRGVQAVHAPRCVVIGAGHQVQVQAQRATLCHHLIRGVVELIDPVVQDAAQRSRQPEHPAVLVITRDQHDGAAGLQRGDRGIQILADLTGIEVRAQRVIHPGQDHRNVGPHRQCSGQLPVPEVGHPCTDGGQVEVLDLAWRAEGCCQQRTEATPAARGQPVTQSDRSGITEHGQTRNGMATRQERDSGECGERCHGHAPMITRRGSPPVSN